jgi:2-keto-4-pentenoate hydratase/2-oxohepta-3-ene-1,7-dioic acid hydratase in catechol pathway
LRPRRIAPEKIICVGLNYRRHALEVGFTISRTPAIFGKFANSLVGSVSSVVLPVRFRSLASLFGGRRAMSPVKTALDE